MSDLKRGGPSFTWMAFLAMAFAVVGLTGLFATFGAPLPLERAMARDATLDEALAASRQPDAQVAIEALRPRLAESADTILPVGGDMEARIGQARAEMRALLQREEDATTARLRLMILIVTVMGAVFGAAVLNFARGA